MNLQDLINRYRFEAFDSVVPYLVSDAQVIMLLNEAQEEAALRGRLIHENTDSAVCRITSTEGQASYPLHQALFELSHCSFIVDGETMRNNLGIVSAEYLDKLDQTENQGWVDSYGSMIDTWRDAYGLPLYVIQTDNGLRLVPTPSSFGMIILEGYRFPLQQLSAMDDVPELNVAHHVKLVQWVLHKVFNVPDHDLFDPSRADRALDSFEKYFGIRPDSDLRRITRHDVPHHVEVFWA
jgi:hypothetical protein